MLYSTHNLGHLYRAAYHALLDQEKLEDFQLNCHAYYDLYGEQLTLVEGKTQTHGIYFITTGSVTFVRLNFVEWQMCTPGKYAVII